MSSQTRDTRGDGNGLDLRTLVIASVAAAVAAVVVSRIWTAGTPIAAAATPVIVTILKELLDRPTAKIAEKVTVASPALRETRVWDRPRAEEPETRATEVTPPTEHEPGDVRVYRQQPAGWRSRINTKVVAITAALAFVIAGVVLTGGQVLAGNPFGKDGSGAIILGQHKAGKKKTKTQTETEQQQTQTVTEQTTTPQQTTTTPQQTTPSQDQQSQQQQTETTPTTPTETTTTPSR